jgi:hypothetical protein
MSNSQYLVMFGIDSEKKPHAARFKLADETAVRKAASVKDFKVGLAKSKEAVEMANKLPDGKLFDPGNGLAPFISKDSYDRLVPLLEVNEVAAQPLAVMPSPTRPLDLWSAIRIGSVVLVQDPEPGPDRSWWLCKVVETPNQKVLVVRWAQYPKLPIFRVKRAAVAILPAKG